MTEPKIYVACLASYNNGCLHGAWINAANDLEVILKTIKTMLAKSPVADAEEYAIHDYEGFETYQVSEYEGIEAVHEIACFIDEHGALGAELLNHFGDLDEAITAIEEHYYGCYASLADYAQEFTEQTSDIPKHLEFYIDYERMARDWEMSGDVFTIETAHDEVHVFSNF